MSFEQASYTVAEGSSVTVKVKLDAEPERTVTVPLTKANQGGASNSDYSGVPASVTFNGGATRRRADQLQRGLRQRQRRRGVGEAGLRQHAAHRECPQGQHQRDGRLHHRRRRAARDGELRAGFLHGGRGEQRHGEGEAERRPRAHGHHPSHEGQPGRGIELRLLRCARNVTFNSGDTEKSITFSAASDSDNDDGESVKLGFGSLPAGVSAGSTNETVVSITDDDVPSVEVSFEQGSYTVTEGSSVTVKVKLDAEPERTVTVPLTKANQGGASSSDYSGVPASVTFNSGDTEKSITFSAASDSDNDDGESVKLGFGTLPAGVSAGSTDEATVSITDDDLPSSVTVEFGASSYSVTEGGDVEVTVTLNVDPERSVTIPLSKANQGGASDSDYSGVPLSVTFDSSETEKSFTLEAAPDNLEDSGESVKLGFGALPTGVSAGTTVEATVSITNVSAQNSLTVNFGASGYGLTEGDTTMIAVTLSTAPGSEVTIPLTKTEQSGATSTDYSGIPASLTFGSSDTSKTFTFTAIEDTIDDDGESVKLGFGNLPEGVSAGPTAETTVSITDDDVPPSRSASSRVRTRWPRGAASR